MMPLLPPHVRNAYDYPQCCGEATVLRHHGWFCVQCRNVLPFRDAEGRTWQELAAIKSREQKQRAKKKAMQ